MRKRKNDPRSGTSLERSPQDRIQRLQMDLTAEAPAARGRNKEKCGREEAMDLEQ